jgi:hypothetical protein
MIATPERLARATAYLESVAEKIRPLDRETRIVAALAPLICDDDGFIAEASLVSAMADPDLVSAAELLVSAVLR